MGVRQAPRQANLRRCITFEITQSQPTRLNYYNVLTVNHSSQNITCRAFDASYSDTNPLMHTATHRGRLNCGFDGFQTTLFARLVLGS